MTAWRWDKHTIGDSKSSRIYHNKFGQQILTKGFIQLLDTGLKTDSVVCTRVVDHVDSHPADRTDLRQTICTDIMKVVQCILANCQSVWCINDRGWCKAPNYAAELKKLDRRKLSGFIWLRTEKMAVSDNAVMSPYFHKIGQGGGISMLAEILLFLVGQLLA